MSFQIIPAIDILDGKVVRLTQGDYHRVQHFDTDAVSLAQRYVDGGAKRIHLVDLNGAKDGQLVNAAIVSKIRSAVDVELDLGGGIRNLETAKQLFDLGLDILILGSLLVKQPEISEEIIRHFPNQITAGLDANNNFIATEGWTEGSEISVESMLKKLSPLPLQEVIFTDIAKDGTLEGPNLQALKLTAEASTFPVVASGGISSVADIEAVAEMEELGVCGVIVGKALLSGAVPFSF